MSRRKAWTVIGLFAVVAALVFVFVNRDRKISFVEKGLTKKTTPAIVFPYAPYLPTSHPEVFVVVRPLVSRLQPDEPMSVAFHFQTRFGPSDCFAGIWNENVFYRRTQQSIVASVTTPDGKQFELRMDPNTPVSQVDAAGPLCNMTTFLIPLSKHELYPRFMRIAWPDDYDVTQEGTYRVKVSGTIDSESIEIQDVTFQCAEVSFEITTDGIISLKETLDAAGFGQTGDNPKDAYRTNLIIASVREDQNGNRVVGTGYPTRAVVSPDGVVVDKIATPRKGIPQCLAEGTLVDTGQGLKPVELIEIGDTVCGYDFKRQVKLLASVRHIDRRIAEQTLEFPCGLRVTAEHPIWAAGEWKSAGTVRPNDRLWHSDGRFETARMPRIIDTPVYVYDLTVDKPNNFFASGVLVHNKSVIVPSYLLDYWYDLWPLQECPVWPQQEWRDDPEQRRRAEHVNTIGGSFLKGVDSGYRIYFDADSQPSAADLEFIAGLKGITGLMFRTDVQLSQIAMGKLCKFDELHSVHFVGAVIEEGSFQILREIPGLTDLRIRSVLLTEEETQLVCNLTGLTRLGLEKSSGKRVDDGNVESLKKLTKLRFLNIVNTAITDKGARDLQNVLPKCEIIHRIMWRK